MGPCTCLVVDDEPAIRAYVSAILKGRQINCVEATNAQEALRVLRDMEDGVDLVVTDIQMPGDMNGIDLAYSLCYSRPRLPLILISGYTDQVPPSFPFIPKPFRPKALLEEVDRAFLRVAAAT